MILSYDDNALRFEYAAPGFGSAISETRSRSRAVPSTLPTTCCIPSRARATLAAVAVSAVAVLVLDSPAGGSRAGLLDEAGCLFRLGPAAALPGLAFEDLTRATVPRDFAGNRPWSYALLPGALLFVPAVATWLPRLLG